MFYSLIPYRFYDSGYAQILNNSSVREIDATIETKTPTDNILTFTAHTFSSGNVVTVESGNISDTFTFE